MLVEVIGRMEKHAFRLNQEKRLFLLLRIEYLGHEISSDGIRPLPTKVEAIIKPPVPGNISAAGESSCACFHLFLVSLLFTGLSLLALNFDGNFFIPVVKLCFN